MSNTRARSDALQAAARRLLEDRKVDITEQVDFRAFGRELATQEGCHVDTATAHIGTAVRRMRGEYTAAQHGGKRDGAGAKPVHPPKTVIQSATITSGYPALVTYLDSDGNTAINIGGNADITEIQRDGSDRRIKLTFADGSRMNILLFGN